MKAIDITIVENAHISQAMNATRDLQLRRKAGTLQKVIYGPGDQDFANALVKGYAGSMYYRQTHAKYDRRRFLYVHALSLALNRLTEDRAATTKPPQTQDERIAFLDAIAADFENVKVSSGVGHALDMEVHRQLIFDKAQGALIGKTVEEKEDGTMEERPKKRRKIEQYERSKALLARGGVKSAERMKQLEELRARDSLAEKLGVEGSFVGPDGDRASSEAFSKWFLGLKENASLQQSLNAHGRTPEGVQAHLANGKRLGEFNTALFSGIRHQRAEEAGGWIPGEQLMAMKVVIGALDGDLT